LTLLPRPFWFIRHGETDWNAQNLSQGAVDVPLNPTGEAQAHAAARLLVDRGIEAIYASPLSRARRTAEIIGASLGLAVEVVPDLREVAFGDREGQPMGDWFHEWIAGRFTPAGGEAFAALRARAVAAINALLARPPAPLIVAHGSFFRALRSAMGLPADVRTRNAAPLQCLPPAAAGGAWRLLSVEGEDLSFPPAS
jgi:broad specificity phosphatase PhoE